MPEVKYIDQERRPILLMDFSGIEDYSVMPALVAEAIRLAQSSNTRSSVLAVIDLSGTRITRSILELLKTLSKHNGPFTKSVAFVGLDIPWSLLISIFLRTSGRRNHRVFKTRHQAVYWLVGEQ